MATEPFLPKRMARKRELLVEEAKRLEAEETVRAQMAALDYERAQDERWAKLSPRLIEALDSLFGAMSKLEPPSDGHIITD